MKPPEALPFDHLQALVLVAGISGAGKSTAIDTLSDLGFFTIENLPVPLFPEFLKFSRQNPTRFTRTALNLDIDSKNKQEQLIAMLKNELQGLKTLQVIFLDCKAEVIVKRYGQTRRPHPGFNAAIDKTLEDAILREKKQLLAIRETANLVIDTSELTIHDLGREIRAFIESSVAQANQAVRVNFLSFGFKHGVPIDCDLLIDVRFLPNPYFDDNLRDKSGLEQEVVDYVLSGTQADEFVRRYVDLLKFLLPHYVYSGKLYLNVGVGCTGGRHRSVVISEKLASEMTRFSKAKDYTVSVKHRDIKKG